MENGTAATTEPPDGHPSAESPVTHSTPSSANAPDRPASPTRFLNQDEPGGIDDVDTWLALTVAMIPVGAIVGIIAHYVLSREQDGALWSLLTGVGVAAVMFVILYVLYRRFRFNTAQHASVVTYNDLCERMHRVASIELPTYDDPSLHAAARAAIIEVRQCGEAFDYGRKKPGLHWVLAKGYLDLARVVHRAEEAAILYEPINVALDDGLKDQSRIDDSTMSHADDLLNRLRRALITLSPASASYLPQLPPAADCRHTGQDPMPLSPEAQARIVLSNVRFTVNDFRDSAKSRLIDARNELLARMFLTGLATWLLVVFVVLGRPPETALLTSATLYAIGATVGLFSRLYADLSSDSFGDDYAISYVRLFQTFLLSGHAAIAGVYIAVALPFVLNNPVLQLQPTTAITATATVSPAGSPLLVTVTPAPTAAVSTPQAPPTAAGASGSVERSANGIPRLVDVYNVDRYPFSIILAMIFGLTPGLLISRLAQGIEGSKQDLRSSELSTKGRT